MSRPRYPFRVWQEGDDWHCELVAGEGKDRRLILVTMGSEVEAVAAAYRAVGEECPGGIGFEFVPVEGDGE